MEMGTAMEKGTELVFQASEEKHCHGQTCILRCARTFSATTVG